MSKDKKRVKRKESIVTEWDDGATTLEVIYYDEEGIPCPDPHHPCT